MTDETDVLTNRTNVICTGTDRKDVNMTLRVANYYAAPQNFNGAASAWMLNFSLISLLVFMVSAYCLSVAHFFAYLNEALMADELNSPDNSGSIR